MKKSIGKFGTILIILVTVILAGVAIFTALRLYQLRQQPVAPNVPTSKPEAATACTDDVKQCPDGTYVRRLPPDCNFAPCPGSCSIGFTIAPSQCNGTCATNADCQSSSTTTSTSPNLICFQPTATPCPERGCITVMPPKVCRNTLCTSDEDCICSTPTPRATATPTPTPTPVVTPTATPPNPSATPNSCGGTCGSNINCASGLYCYTSLGICRNASCPTEADCNCPAASTPTPGSGTGTAAPGATPAPSLPVSGTDWPTIFGAGIGLFVIIGSLLLAL